MIADRLHRLTEKVILRQSINFVQNNKITNALSLNCDSLRIASLRIFWILYPCSCTGRRQI